METAVKTKQITFREWYDSLEPLEKREFRNEFIRVSGIQFSTFYPKLQRNSFSKLEKEAIQKLIGEQNEITF